MGSASEVPAPTCPMGGSRHADGDDIGGVASQFIVRFKDWAMAEVHHSRLSAALPGEGTGWQWVPRSNKAAGHPTDFGLVRMLPHPHGRSGPAPFMPQPTEDDGSLLRGLQGMISGVSFVRDVHEDR